MQSWPDLTNNFKDIRAARAHVQSVHRPNLDYK